MSTPPIDPMNAILYSGAPSMEILNLQEFFFNIQWIILSRLELY